MITISNYAEKIGEIGIANLNPTLRDGHDFIVEASIDFTDWSFYEDPDLKEVVDLYLDKLNSFFSAKRDNKTSIIKDFYNTLDTYQKASLRNGKLSEDKKKLAETLGLTIHDLQSYDVSIRKTGKKKDSAKSEKPKVKPEPKGQSFKQVEHLKEEIKYIKRYVALHKKTKTPNAILNFVKALQKSIIQKLITKDSPLVEEIRLIQDRLVETYNKMKKPEHLTIKDEELPKWVVLAGGEEVYPSINLIKRFVGFQGKPLQEKSLNAYLKAIESARNKKKVIEGDPYLDKIQSIEKILKKAKPGDTLEVGKASLNGLNGIVSACSCKHGLGKIYNTKGKKLSACKKKTYTDARGKGSCSHNKGLSGVMTAEEMANRKHETLELEYPWSQIVGNPAKNFVMMLHGEPGSGKTTLLLKFSKYLAENFYQRAIYITSEEYEASTMTDKVNELLIPQPDNLDFAGDLKSVNLKNYDLVILDSINDLGLNLMDFKALREQNKDTAFIMILQNTKAGQFKGGKEWEHEAQIAGKVDVGSIQIYKNRFGRIHNEPLNFFEGV